MLYKVTYIQRWSTNFLLQYIKLLQAGIYLFQLLNYYTSAGIALTIIIFFECIAIFYGYGTQKTIGDLNCQQREYIFYNLTFFFDIFKLFMKLFIDFGLNSLFLNLKFGIFTNSKTGVNRDMKALEYMLQFNSGWWGKWCWLVMTPLVCLVCCLKNFFIIIYKLKRNLKQYS